MNNSDFFFNPVNSIQLLPMIQYMYTLNHFLYVNDFLAISDQFKPIPIVNALFDYFDTDDNVRIKTNLVYKLLEGSDLYEGKKNISSDFEYVNATFDYIISNVISLYFGNIYGFCVASLLSTDNLTPSFFQEHLKNYLKNATYANEDGSISQLSDLAASKIHERFISPLFPQAEGNMSILSYDYLHAIAGLSFARAIDLDLQNVTFDELIQMSQTVEMSVQSGQLDNASLNIFSLPATLYFANTTRNLTQGNISKNVTRPLYWSRAYQHLFSYFNSHLERAQKVLKNNELENYVHQFHLAMAYYKNRTQLAEENIRLHCSLEKEDDYEQEVVNYKNNPANYRCPGKGAILQNLTKVYSDQIHAIGQSYFWMETALIEEAYGRERVSQINNTKMVISQCVIRVTINLPTMIISQITVEERLKEGVDLLRFYYSNKTSHYEALIREKDKIFHIAESHPDFYKKLGLSQYTNFDCQDFLKGHSEGFGEFKQRLAARRAADFAAALYKSGFEKTGWEKAKEIILSFVPFYNCINDIKGGRSAEAKLDCSLDVIAFVPIYGQAVSTGLNIITRSFLATLGSSARSFVFRESICLSLRTIGRGFLLEAATQLTKVFTRQFFKNLGISIVRALDPGFELIGKLTMYGIRGITRLFSLIGRRLSSALSARISSSLSRLGKLVSKIKIDNYKGFDVHANSPSFGGFEDEYVSTASKNFQLRSLSGLRDVIPVKLSKKNGKIYKETKLGSGDIHGTKSTLDHGMQLLRVNHEFPLNPDIPESGIELSEEITDDVLVVKGSGSGADLNDENKLRHGVQVFDKVLISCLMKPGIGTEEIHYLLRHYLLLDKEKTEQDVYQYCKKHLKLPPWLPRLRISNPKLFWNLRSPGAIESSTISYESALEKIELLYGQEEIELVGLDIKELNTLYKFKQLYNILKFEDFYAIANYLWNDISMFPISHLVRCQNALYRLAIRQTNRHISTVPELYLADLMNSEYADSHVIGSDYTFDKFMFSTLRRSDFNGVLNKYSRTNVHVIYRIQLHSFTFAAYLGDLFPDFKNIVVLLPQSTFTVIAIEDITLDGMSRKEVVLRSVPVDLSEALATCMKKIDQLLDTNIEFYIPTTDVNRRYSV